MDRDDGRPLNVLDAELARLRERFPAWRVWWIRNAVSRAVSWHAQPSRFPLSASGPDELAGLIDAEPAWE